MASSPSPENHRKNMDVTKLVSSSHEVTVNGLNDFVVKFHGPKDTPYEGGVWKVKVHVHESYPYRPPTIRFINTGKSLSEALIFASTNSQYDNRLFIELRVQYMKIASSEHFLFLF